MMGIKMTQNCHKLHRESQTREVLVGTLLLYLNQAYFTFERSTPDVTNGKDAKTVPLGVFSVTSMWNREGLFCPVHIGLSQHLSLSSTSQPLSLIPPLAYLSLSLSLPPPPLSLSPLERTDLRRCPGILLSLSSSVLAADRTVKLRLTRRSEISDTGKNIKLNLLLPVKPGSLCAPEKQACCLITHVGCLDGPSGIAEGGDSLLETLLYMRYRRRKRWKKKE